MKSIKRAAALAAAVLLLAGCGSQKAVTETDTGASAVSETESLAETTEETTAVETTEETTEESAQEESQAELPDDYAYGEDAMTYLRYINDNFPYRVIGNPDYPEDTKEACGAWIRSTMEGMGYETTMYSYRHLAYVGDSGLDVNSYAFRKPGASGKRIVIGAHYDSRETHGCEDNGTGVSLVLELAKRFSTEDTPLTLEFCFWDAEELRGEAGSYGYMEQVADKENIVLYINLDCVGSGDDLYAYGGDYVDGVLVRDWAYNMAMEIASEYGIELNTIPDRLEEEEFTPPTRTIGSDQLYFNKNGIPYVYFEANAWVDENGVEQYPNGNMSYQYNTKDSQFLDTQGEINHMYCDDLDILEERLPGRIRSHISQFSAIITKMLKSITADSAS